ncbi:MAG: YafY family protein [Pseudomonadota bacterium]
MRRTDRLFELLQLFRGGRLRRGIDLADRLGVSLRTVYRDIETLIGSGVPIEGERGIGYILREPIFLPPLSLSPVELEALHLGMAMVEKSSDGELADAAKNLLIKVDSVLPSDRPRTGHPWGFAVYNADNPPDQFAMLTILRPAVRERNKVAISYTRLDGPRSKRTIRPLQVEYWGQVWTCTAWCELRQDFRVFRVDRIAECRPTGDRFSVEPGKRLADYFDQLDTGKA